MKTFWHLSDSELAIGYVRVSRKRFDVMLSVSEAHDSRDDLTSTKTATGGTHGRGQVLQTKQS